MTIICQGLNCRQREICSVEDVFFAKDHPYCENCFKAITAKAEC